MMESVILIGSRLGMVGNKIHVWEMFCLISIVYSIVYSIIVGLS